MTFHYTFPPYTEKILANGLRVIWVSDYQQPVITITLQIPYGRNYDPYSFEGTADLTANLMVKASQSYPSEIFSEKFEHSGSLLFCESREEATIFGVRLLEQAADEIVPLFWDMICNPAFAQTDFKLLKTEILTALKAEHAENIVLVNKHFNATLFGSSHPYGRTATIDSIKRITIDNIKEFFAKYISPENSYLIVAGSRKRQEMQQQWEELFSGWNKKGTASLPHIAPIPELEQNKIRLINKPEYSQCTLLMGHHCVSELHEKKIHLAIANYILGGGNFTSRLMKRIRSETGQTYGISSQLSTQRTHGVFSISTSTQNRQLRGVLNSIFDVYNQFTDNGAHDDEITKAIHFALGNMAFELEGINNVVEKLLWLRFYNRENTYIEQFEKQLAQVDVYSVNAALKDHFKSSSFVIIVAGRKKDIYDQLRQFGHVECYESRDNHY